MNLKIGMIVVATVLLTACSTPKIELNKDAVRNIRNLVQVLYIPQNNLDISVSASNPGNSGVIGALFAMAVDAVR